MFIAVNRIAAPPQAIERMVAAFHQNAASLKEFQGFIAFELWRGEAALDAVSKWESRAAFEAWRDSDNFLAAHVGPRGGQSGQGGSSVAYYEGETVVVR
jgi:heme-degrading monooxygenase HmoA